MSRFNNGVIFTNDNCIGCNKCISNCSLMGANVSIVKNGKTENYYFTDEEFNKVRSKIKGEVQRAKGLGALSVEQAKRSMFTPEFQRMDVLEPDPDSIYLLEQLMGEDVEPRKKFIFSSIDFSEVRE